MEPQRTEVIKAMATKDEKKDAKELAKFHGRTLSNLVLWLLRQEKDRLKK